MADEQVRDVDNRQASGNRASRYAWPEKPALIGTAVQRLDGPDKVTGRARYTYDINRPGMIFGKMVRSPYPHARVVSVDLSAAEKAPGVKAVLAYVQPGAQVMYQGDPVAGVAADTEERAVDAARLVRVRYETLPHLSSVEQAMAENAPAVFPNGNTRKATAEETGDLTTGFASAAHIVEATYATHVITHVCLETHGCVCEWDGDKLTAWISTQAVIQSAQGFAQGLGIPQANVHTITQYMGGGFGSKFAPDAQGIICAKLAQDGEAAGQADAGSQRGAPRHRQPAVGDRAHPRWRDGGRYADRVRRSELGHRRGRRAERLSAAIYLRLSEP